MLKFQRKPKNLIFSKQIIRDNYGKPFPFVNECSKKIVKVGLPPSKKLVLSASVGDLWKWWKIVFISSFFRKTFTFLSRLSRHVGKQLDKKESLISKFMTSQIENKWLQYTCCPKGNQTWQIGHLIECNMKKTSLDEPYTK